MTTIETVTGPADGAAISLALPHEHLFADLSRLSEGGGGRIPWPSVRAAGLARLAALRALGVDLLVDCTPPGIGRRLPLLQEVSRETGVLIAWSTGVYKALLPRAWASLDAGQLAERLIAELVDGDAGTSSRAAMIKLAADEAGPTAVEERGHRAGGRAAVATGSSVVVHATGAEAMRRVVATLEDEGVALERVVWAHAQTGTAEDNLELAERGVTVSLDGISAVDDPPMVDRIERLVGAGHGDRVVVSTDTTVWMHPAEWAYERSIEHLIGTFLPLVEARLGRSVRERLVRHNVLAILERPDARVGRSPNPMEA